MAYHKQINMRNNGYTLMELMVVLALVAIMAVLAAPRVSQGFQGAQLRTAVKQFAAALRAARSLAVTERSRIIADIEIQGRQYNFKRYSNRQRTSDGGLNVGIHESGDRNDTAAYIPKILQEPFELPEGIYFSGFMIDNANVTGFNTAFIEFFPRGNSTGGSVVIQSDGGTAYSISINRVTGRVFIESIS